MEDQLASARGGVDVLRQAAEPDLALLEFAHSLDEVSERPAEPVELPHHQRVALAGKRDRLREPRPLDVGTTGHVGKDLAAAGFLKRVALQIEILVDRRDPRVADQHGPIVAEPIRMVAL